MPLSPIKKLAEAIESEADRVALSTASPILLGPRASATMRRIMRLTLLTALLLAAASPLSLLLPKPYALILPVVSILLALTPYILPMAWRLVLAHEVSRELPSLLSYALPYSAGPKYLADVLAAAPREFFPWFEWEADRLRFLLDLGHDPITALKELASTTPSRRLREILLDYVHSQEIGSPKSQVTLSLLEEAVNETRSQWRSYIDLGRGLVEALTATVLASVVLAPLSLLSGYSGAPAVLVAAILSLVSGILLVMTRPNLGEVEVGVYYTLGALLAAIISSLATYISGALAGLAVLAIAAGLYEHLHKRFSRIEEEALSALREAAAGAKYGRFLEDHLSRAVPVASRSIKALIKALGYAGKIGAAEALSSILRIVESAKEAVHSARGQGLVLTGLATVIPAVSIYIVKAIASIGSTGQMPGLGAEGLEAMASLILAVSPLIPIPGTVLWRGRVPSLIPSLAALSSSLLVTRL